MNNESRKVLNYLKNVFDEFERVEESLIATNQQLEANNQQLKASEEEIRLEEVKVRDALRFSESIFSTLREPFVVLDNKLKIVKAGKSFYEEFQVSEEDTLHRYIYELGNNQWGFPELRKVLEDVLPQKNEIFNYEIRHEFESIGFRIFLLNAREIMQTFDSQKFILLAFENITERKLAQEKIQAAFQQLRATEQQLRAVNQQLRAGEQQLRAVIHQQKHTEQSLRQERDFSRNLLDTASSIIVVLDTQANIILFSHYAEKISGYSKSEVMGKNWFDIFIQKSDGKKISAVFSKVLDEMPDYSSYENQILCKNADLIDVSWQNTLVKDDEGKPTGVLSIGLDITEKKRAEEVQKEMNMISNAVITTNNLEEFIVVVKKCLSHIIDTTNFYIALYEDDTDSFTLAFHEDKKENITSFKAGKTLTNYVFKTAKPLLATKEVEQKLLELGEIEIVGANSKIWLGIPLMVKGKAIGVLAVQSYDNEKAYSLKDMETLELVSHHISLAMERKMAEDDIKTSLENALKSERLKNAFLSNMSHEIRTPMNGILGFLDLLNDVDISIEEREEYIAAVKRSGKRMVNTINDLIEISKIESGLVPMAHTEICVHEIFDNLILECEDEAIQKGLSIYISPVNEDKKRKLTVDRYKLHVVLYNLIKNAIKFTKNGSVSMGYRIQDKKIEFFVKDTGVGIPKERQGAIFNRFEQAEIGDVRSFEGVGLGLAISKAYVEMMRGEIWVKSEEGKGSEFIFSLPI